MSIRTISPQQLHELIRGGQSVSLIDVRTPIEYREVHVASARNLPLDKLSVDQISNTVGSVPELYVICRSGSRGQQACEKLAGGGMTNVINVAGGTQAWDAAGLPVVRGQKAISLERQVRIAAGTLVLIGALLGMFYNPLWFGLPAFVGAGLVVSGLTDTCGMGLLLARMPWNRVRAETTEQPACKTA